MILPFQTDALAFSNAHFGAGMGSVFQDEIAKREDAVARWVRANRRLVQPDQIPRWKQHQDSVIKSTSHIPAFQRSPSDMAGLCTALAFNDRARSQGFPTRLSVVVRDDQYEAACFATGITAISPAAFVLTGAGLNLPSQERANP